MMNRIKLSVIAEKFPEIGVYLVDDKYNEPRMYVVQASVGKPLYGGKIPLSIGKSSFVSKSIDGDTWVYVPQYDYRKYISPSYSQKFGRPTKDESDKNPFAKGVATITIDKDLHEWLYSQKPIRKYVNNLIRKDMEERKLKKQEENNMEKMNAYNFIENGCVFYHVIAENEEQCYSLAEGAGIDVAGMELELERMNVRDELGKPYRPRIEEAFVH